MALDLAALLPIVTKGIEEAWKWKRGKAQAEKESQEELCGAFELATRLAGSLLFELRANVERVRLIVADSKSGAITLGTFDFAISDSIMPRLCEVLPTPAVLGEFHFALSAVRRVAFYQSTGAKAPLLTRHDEVLGTSLEEDRRGFERAISFAHDAMNKGLVERFNALREMTVGIGQAALGETWQAVEASFLPSIVDATAPIDHSLL